MALLHRKQPCSKKCKTGYDDRRRRADGNRQKNKIDVEKRKILLRDVVKYTIMCM